MKILVWDLPTRLFHWLLAGAFAAGWLTSGSARWLDFHVFAGYLLGGLACFRLMWGVAGSRYAKFASFTFSAGEAFAYLRAVLRGGAARHVGHNPAGSWAIYLLLLGVLLATLSGLLVLGGEEQQGLLAGVISIAAGERIKAWHEWLAYAMLGLVVAHLLGVAVESWLHRENLPRAMLTGYKRGMPGEAISSACKVVALVLLALTVGLAAWYFKGYLSATEKQPYLPLTGPALADNATWRSECGSCHLAYHPTLLPARSWQRMLREQNQHFGEMLGLDEATSAEILAFLARHSADTQQTEAAYKIGKSIAPASAPQRITETGYWREKHQAIQNSTWSSQKVGSRANCAACHLDAEGGRFEDGAMRIPPAN